MALPRGAIGLSAVCDCVIPCSYSLTIYLYCCVYMCILYREPYMRSRVSLIHIKQVGGNVRLDRHILSLFSQRV